MKSKKKLFALKPSIIALSCGVCLISSVSFSLAWFISNTHASVNLANIRYGDNINIANSYIVTTEGSTFNNTEDRLKVTLDTYDIYIPVNNLNKNAIVVIDLTLSENTSLLVTSLGEELADTTLHPLSYVAHTSYYLAPITDVTLQDDGSVSYNTANAYSFLGQNTLAQYSAINDELYPTGIYNEYSFPSSAIPTEGRYLLFVNIDYDKTNVDNFLISYGTDTAFDSANNTQLNFSPNITILLGNSPTRTLR